MPGCLSQEQIAELLRGRAEQSVAEHSAAHLDECDDCRQQFIDLAHVPDADGWRNAAMEQPPLDVADQGLLNGLKSLPPRRPSSADLTELPAIDSSNGKSSRPSKKSGAPVARLNRFPDVPGFEILAELGRGGMGVVYKALQPAHDRLVALKMILAGLQASPEDMGRFIDEAEAISRLRHPHIVQIFEVGQAEGRLFFVLEFVEGGTLADRIKKRTLPPRSAAQLLETLARAMNYAHERGIVHRDLKPANVLLHSRKAFLDIPEEADRLPEEWDFRRFMPKITDFGLAKVIDRNTANGRTASGDVVGTPSYMAPEQAQGRAGAIGPGTDVYSLGAILYEMLTGRPPFQGATPMDTLFQVHTQEPTPLRKLDRNIPLELETICLKCLRKDPQQRYESAGALAEELKLFLDGLPLQTRGIRSRWMGVQSLRRRAGGWLTVALMFVLALVTGAALVAMWIQDENRKQAAQPARGDAPAVRELIRLRLRNAQLDCQRGETVRGLHDMAALLAEFEKRPEYREECDAVRLNLTAWAWSLPDLEWVSRTKGPAVAMAANGEVWFAGATPKLPRNPTSFQTAGAPDSDGAEVVAVSANGQSTAVAVVNEVRWWDFERGKLRASIPGITDVQGLRLAADGSALLFNGEHRGEPGLWLVTWDPAGNQTPMEKLGPPAAAWAWHPADRQALVVWPDGKFELLSAESKRDVVKAGKFSASVTSIAWFADGATVALGCGDGQVRFWSRQEAKAAELATLRAHGAGPVLVATDARLLLTAGADRTLKLWRPATGDLLIVMPHPSPATQLEAANGWFITRDGAGTVRASNYGLLRFVRDGHLVRDGSLLRWVTPSPAGPPGAGTRLVARHAGLNQALTIDADGVLRLQLPASDRREALSIDGAEFRRATFSADGRLLLTISSDGGRLWDAHPGIPVGPLLPLPAASAGMFLDDHSQLIVWSETDARLWPSPTPSANFTAADWRGWLRGRTGIDRTGEGLLRWLDPRDWQPEDRWP